MRKVSVCLAQRLPFSTREINEPNVKCCSEQKEPFKRTLQIEQEQHATIVDRQESRPLRLQGREKKSPSTVNQS